MTSKASTLVLEVNYECGTLDCNDGVKADGPTAIDAFTISTEIAKGAY